MLEEKVYDVIIIGVGFVGMMVVVYILRVNLLILMIERGISGG